MKKNSQKKAQWQQWVMMAIFVAVGAICGIFMVDFIDQRAAEGASVMGERFMLLVLLLGLYVSYYLHICIHEAGHLVFGLRSGYRFSSFRIGSIIWLKENGKIVRRKYSLAGTGGQCLMAPPDMKNGKIPVVLYNLGGCILNLLTSAVASVAYLLIPRGTMLSVLLLMFVLMGVISALTNGIPLRLGTVDNDGYNACALGKNPEAMRAFWLQLKVNEQVTKGVRLKDMPEEWFTLPADDAMKNSMVATQGVLVSNRLMDQHDFEEADRLMAHLLEIDSGIIGLHRGLMICDRMYLELIRDNRKETLDGMRTKEQLRLMKAMRSFPSVVRTEYVYALLGSKDAVKAQAALTLFTRIEKTYPYPGDIRSGRELMETAAKVAGAV